MSKQPKMNFADWLIRRYRVVVRDMSQAKLPFIWRKFKNIDAFAVKGKYIYVRNLSKINNYDRACFLVHECCHIEQQRKYGWIRFLARYAFSKHWRCKLEVTAYTRTLEFIKLNGHNINGLAPKYSKQIAKVYYLGSSQRDRATFLLKRNCDWIINGSIHVVKDLYNEWTKDVN